jgi:hypothetical protein
MPPSPPERRMPSLTGGAGAFWPGSGAPKRAKHWPHQSAWDGLLAPQLGQVITVMAVGGGGDRSGPGCVGTRGALASGQSVRHFWAALTSRTLAMSVAALRQMLPITRFVVVTPWTGSGRRSGNRAQRRFGARRADLEHICPHRG